MMRLIKDGEPYIYSHKCTNGEKVGDPLTGERLRQFLIETLYESFRQCNSNITKINDSWSIDDADSLKQKPDLIYRMSGASSDTWLYVMPNCDDKNLIDLSFINEKINHEKLRLHDIIPVLVIGSLWCFETDGTHYICGGSYAAKYDTISLLPHEDLSLPVHLSQRQLVEKVALSWQNLDVNFLEPFLDNDFHYTSDAVFYEISSRREYVDYLRGKFETLKRGSNPIHVQMGRMDNSDNFALLLHQGAYNQSLLLTIEAMNGRIKSMRMSEYQ